MQGVSAYKQLKATKPELCQAIVLFAEKLAVRHNLEPAVAVDVKQALTQFAVDIIKAA